MKSKNIEIKRSKKKFLEPFNKLVFCEVSKASAEIMLERFCNGKKIDFTFSKWLGLFGYNNFFRIYM